MPGLLRMADRALSYASPLAAAYGSHLLGRSLGFEDSLLRDASAGGVAALANRNPIYARMMLKKLVPRVAAVGALDTAQRASLGYSAFDPKSVQEHTKQTLAKEIEPILRPWTHPQSPPPSLTGPKNLHSLSNSQLIRMMRGQSSPPPASVPRPRFFG